MDYSYNTAIDELHLRTAFENFAFAIQRPAKNRRIGISKTGRSILWTFVRATREKSN